MDDHFMWLGALFAPFAITIIAYAIEITARDKWKGE